MAQNRASAKPATMKHLARLLLIVTTSQTVPTLTNVTVEEGSAAVLPCALSSKQDIRNFLFKWNKDRQEVFMYDAGVHDNNGQSGQDEQFKARVSHLEEELKHGNASIRINNTRVSDSGNYTCLFPRLNPPRMFSVQLVVSPSYMYRLAENILGASMTPYTAILNATEDGVTLRCEVAGFFPKPKLEWQDSHGNVLPAEEPQVSEKRGCYHVSLRSTVSRTTTNLFVCVARREDIHHEAKAEIYVPDKMFEECKVSDQISGHDWTVGLGILIGVVGTSLTSCTIRKCQRDKRVNIPKICLCLLEGNLNHSDTQNHSVLVVNSHSDSDQCGLYTAVPSPSTCSKCGETLEQSAPNSHAAPKPGPAGHTKYLCDTQRSTEKSHSDSFQHEPQTAEPVNSSQCGETLAQSATNGRASPIHEMPQNTKNIQKSAGKPKQLTTQEKSGAEHTEDVGYNKEIKLDVEPDNRD